MKTILIALAACAMAGCAGPKISVLGDSYSTYADVSQCAFPYYGPAIDHANGTYVDDLPLAHTWWMRFADAVGGTVEANHSVGGAPMARAFEGWVEGLGKPDVLVVFGGMNDDWGGVDGASFRASCDRLFATIRAKQPQARVFVLVNHPNHPRFGHNNGLRPSTRQALFDAAADASFTAVDLSCLDPARDMVWPNGDCHPNDAGMSRIAAALSAAYFNTPPAVVRGSTDK